MWICDKGGIATGPLRLAALTRLGVPLRLLSHRRPQCVKATPQAMLERSQEIASMARRPSHGHRKAVHRHDVSFLTGRAGVAAVQLHLAQLTGGDSAAEAPLLEVQSLEPHQPHERQECCRGRAATRAASGRVQPGHAPHHSGVPSLDLLSVHNCTVAHTIPRLGLFCACSGLPVCPRAGAEARGPRQLRLPVHVFALRPKLAFDPCLKPRRQELTGSLPEVAAHLGRLEDELLYGRAGLLYALLYARRHAGDGAVPDRLLFDLAQQIVEAGGRPSTATVSNWSANTCTESCTFLYGYGRNSCRECSRSRRRPAISWQLTLKAAVCAGCQALSTLQQTQRQHGLA